MTDTQKSVTVLKILCNTHRYAIMELLLNTEEDLCVNQIASAIGISQSLTSHQLSNLQAHGVIQGHRIGQTTCYKPSETELTRKIADVLNTLT